MFNLKIKNVVPKLRKPAAHVDLRRCLFRTNVDIPLRNTKERQSSTDFSKSHDECCILHAFRGNFKVEIQSSCTSSSPSPTCKGSIFVLRPSNVFYQSQTLTNVSPSVFHLLTLCHLRLHTSLFSVRFRPKNISGLLSFGHYDSLARGSD